MAMIRGIHWEIWVKLCRIEVGEVVEKDVCGVLFLLVQLAEHWNVKVDVGLDLKEGDEMEVRSMDNLRSLSHKVRIVTIGSVRFEIIARS